MGEQTGIWDKVKNFISTRPKSEPLVDPGQIYIVPESGPLPWGCEEQILKDMQGRKAGVYWIDSFRRSELTEDKTHHIMKTHYFVGVSLHGPRYETRVIKGHAALDFDAYVAGALACRDGLSPLDYDIETDEGLAGAVGWGMWYGIVYLFDYPTTDWSDEDIEGMRQHARCVQGQYMFIDIFAPDNPVSGRKYGKHDRGT